MRLWSIDSSCLFLLFVVTCALIDCCEIRPLGEVASLSEAAHVGPPLCHVGVLSAQSPARHCDTWIKRSSCFLIYHTASPPSLVNGTQQAFNSLRPPPPNLSLFISTWRAAPLLKPSQALPDICQHPHLFIDFISLTGQPSQLP